MTHSSSGFMGIVHLFFRNQYLLGLSIMILLVAGFSAVVNLPRLEDPRIDTRNVIAITPYPGASAERVDSLVTDVLEDELRQLHEIKELKSTSRAGISIIFIEVQDWVTSDTNEGIFSKIRDRLDEANQNLPLGVGKTQLDTQRGASSFTLKVAIKPQQISELLIASRLSDELSDDLRNVSGTEIVRQYGKVDEEIRVSVEPQKLMDLGLTTRQLANAIGEFDAKRPAGVIRNQHFNTRIQVADELDGVETVESIPITGFGEQGILQVSDIANVERQWKTPERDIAIHNGERVIFVAARMQPTVRVDTWVHNITQQVDKFRDRFSGTVDVSIVFDQNVYTEERLNGLSTNLLLGCLVVMVVILLFMGTRAAFIVGLALPLSAAFTLFSLAFYEQQIHQMSVFGIIIAIGLLIDNAIVVTDEIRMNLLIPGISRIHALDKSIRHLLIPLTASTLTTILGFMPIFLLPGNTGDFVSPIAISVVMALIGSLFISLTIIAALAACFLPQQEQQQKRWYRSGVQLPPMTNLFKHYLAWMIDHPKTALILPISLPIAGFMLVTQLSNVFFPSADRDQFEIYVWLPPGSSITNTHNKAQLIDAFVRKQPSIKQVDWLVGGSIPSVYYNQVMTRDNTPYFAQAVIKSDSPESASGMIDDLQDALSTKFPKVKIVVRAFGQGPPLSAPVGVDIYGPEVDMLQRLGDEIQYIMSSIPAITESIQSVSAGDPELNIQIPSALSRSSGTGFNTVAQQLNDGFEGVTAGSVLEGSEDLPVRVVYQGAMGFNPWQLSELPLLTPSNDWMTIDAIGDLNVRSSLNAITRTNGVRVNRVEAFLYSDAKAIDVSRALSEQIRQSNLQLPDGYSIKMKGDADKQQEALGQLATYAPVLLVLMITTLILSFSSIKLAAVIASVAILAVGLGLLSLWISGLPLGFNPILASAGLIGVAINGAIVVIAAVKADPDANKGDTEAIVRATMSCSRHILSTTVTTIGGFIPLLLFTSGTFWPPLAVVLAGGVGFSVILSLIYTPVIIALIAKHSTPQLNL